MDKVNMVELDKRVAQVFEDYKNFGSITWYHLHSMEAMVLINDLYSELKRIKK